MYELTKDDVRALRQANRLVVHLSAQYHDGDGLVRLVKDETDELKEKETVLPIPVREEQQYYVDGKVGIRGQNFAHVSLYQNFATTPPATSVLRSLRAGDKVSLAFNADAGTNTYVARAGLHADALWLYVARKGSKSHETYVLDESVCPENSARMCQGHDYSEFIKRDLAS